MHQANRVLCEYNRPNILPPGPCAVSHHMARNICKCVLISVSNCCCSSCTGQECRPKRTCGTRMQAQNEKKRILGERTPEPSLPSSTTLFERANVVQSCAHSHTYEDVQIRRGAHICPQWRRQAQRLLISQVANMPMHSYLPRTDDEVKLNGDETSASDKTQCLDFVFWQEKGLSTVFRQAHQ